MKTDSDSRAQAMHKVRKLQHQLHSATRHSVTTRPDDTVGTVTQRPDMTHRLRAHTEVRDFGNLDPGTAINIFEQEVSEEVRAAEAFQDRHASEFGYFGE